MDLRVARTRNNIINAYIQLRATKPLDKITIKELTENANISKQTFYLHFRDIYDLTDFLENDAIKSLMSDLENPECFLTDPAEAVRQLCTAYISQGNLFNILFPDDDRSYSILVTKIEKLIKDVIMKNHPEFKDDLTRNVRISLFVQGSTNAFLKYKNTNTNEVINILADIISKISA